jgi:hypothetical protein
VPAGSVIPSVFAVAWNDPQAYFNLSFAFPLKQGSLFQNLTQLVLHGNGLIRPVTGYTNGGQYSYRHAKEWFLTTGHPIMACFGHDLLSTSNSTVFVLNNANEFTVTVRSVAARTWISLGGKLINYQCSLYPNGTRTFAFDTTAPTVIPISPRTGVVNAAGTGGDTVIVGWSDGQAHVNRDTGIYDLSIEPKVTTWAEVFAGNQGTDASAIYDVYTPAVAPYQAGVGAASVSNVRLQSVASSSIPSFITGYDAPWINGCPEGSCDRPDMDSFL